MTALFSGPFAQAIGWALLHLLWQGVLVAAILAAALALLQKRSANARYLASCGALMIIVALSIATAYRAYDPIRTSNPTVSAASDTTASPLSVVIEQPAAAVLHWNDVVNAHLSQIVLIWLVGVIILASRLIVGWMSAHRLAARYAHIAQTQWQASMERIAEALHMRRAIQLLESSAVEVPTVVGWLRPAILLPVATLSGLSAEQVEMILAHELAHIRRHDFIINLMQSTVETLFFYQPAVWWISRRIRIEREHCCDDIAVAVTGDALRYARALTRFEELRIDRAQTVLAASGGSLIGRIRRLVRVDGESAGWSSRWTAGVALLVVALTLLAAPTLPAFASRDDEAKQTPAPVSKIASSKSKSSSTCKPSSSQVDVDASAADQGGDVEVPDPPDPPDPDVELTTPMPAPVPAIVGPIVADVPMFAARIAAAVAPLAAQEITPMPATPATPVAAAAPAIGRVRVHPLRHKIDERHLTVDDLVQMRSVGVTARYIDEIRGSGLGDVSLDDIVQMRAVGVTPEYIREIRDAGVTAASADALVQLRAVGVTPAYVRDMAAAGYRNMSAADLANMRAVGVSPDLVKTLADAGYTNLSAQQLIRLAATGVNAAFIRDISKYRTKP